MTGWWWWWWRWASVSCFWGRQQWGAASLSTFVCVRIPPLKKKTKHGEAVWPNSCIICLQRRDPPLSFCPLCGWNGGTMSSWKQYEHQHEQLGPFFLPLWNLRMCVTMPPRSWWSMPVQLARCKKKNPNNKKKKKLYEDCVKQTSFREDDSAESLKNKTNPLLFKTCHQQSDVPSGVSEGSCLCVRMWTRSPPFLIIRHYSFKSHLRSVRRLWNWTGPTIVWRNVLWLAHGPCRTI